MIALYLDKNGNIKYLTDVLSVDVTENSKTVTVTLTEGTTVSTVFTDSSLFDRFKKDLFQAVSSGVLLRMFEDEDEYRTWINYR